MSLEEIKRIARWNAEAKQKGKIKQKRNISHSKLRVMYSKSNAISNLKRDIERNRKLHADGKITMKERRRKNDKIRKKINKLR